MAYKVDSSDPHSLFKQTPRIRSALQTRDLCMKWLPILVCLPLLACEGPVSPEPASQEAEQEEQAAQTPEQARAELASQGIPYSKGSFVDQARQGNLGAVRLFLIAGIDVNVQDDSSHTAVIAASYQGHLDVVQYLVENGADYLSIAMTHAAYGGHLQVMLFLAEKGADLGFYSDGPTTPLTIAAYAGHLDVVRYLVEQGYDDRRRGLSDDNEYGDWGLGAGSSGRPLGGRAIPGRSEV